MNVSQIARKYGVEGTGLANFMRIHEPEVIPWREKVRHWLGINDNTHRGATPACTKQYAEAVELYKDRHDDPRNSRGMSCLTKRF